MSSTQLPHISSGYLLERQQRYNISIIAESSISTALWALDFFPFIFDIL